MTTLTKLYSIHFLRLNTISLPFAVENLSLGSQTSSLSSTDLSIDCGFCRNSPGLSYSRAALTLEADTTSTNLY